MGTKKRFFVLSIVTATFGWHITLLTLPAMAVFASMWGDFDGKDKAERRIRRQNQLNSLNSQATTTTPANDPVSALNHIMSHQSEPNTDHIVGLLVPNEGRQEDTHQWSRSGTGADRDRLVVLRGRHEQQQRVESPPSYEMISRDRVLPTPREFGDGN
eukprot:GHVS01006892.1.p1 GENE.GHVS01006892.1~~GHVS01006892.1.p1  ORF type:complete len:158 (-),score=17.10 GHVS01006892.1:501-974(-)